MIIYKWGESKNIKMEKEKDDNGQYLLENIQKKNVSLLTLF